MISPLWGAIWTIKAVTLWDTEQVMAVPSTHSSHSPGRAPCPQPGTPEQESPIYWIFNTLLEEGEISLFSFSAWWVQMGLGQESAPTGCSSAECWHCLAWAGHDHHRITDTAPCAQGEKSWATLKIKWEFSYGLLPACFNNQVRTWGLQSKVSSKKTRWMKFKRVKKS